MEWVYISDLHKYTGQKVEIRGWLYNIRSKGKIAFLQLRDGTGRVQGVAVKGECNDDAFLKIDGLKMEASISVTGDVRKDSRAPSGVELTINDITVIQNPEEDYPISKKEHGIDFLLEHRHLWLRSSRTEALLKIRNQAVISLRNFFHEKGFILIDTPILTGSIGESSSTLFSVKYFDMGNAYLAQTGQLYLEAACMAFGRVFNLGPTFRAEKSKTRRHLTEFWMLEAEVSFLENEGSMDLQEEMICSLVDSILSKNEAELKVLGRNTGPLKKITAGFPRIEYSEAVKMLDKLGKPVKWGNDLGGDEETILTEQFEKPIFVTNYPKHAKAFYMKENPENPETVLCADLLAPEGYGEIIGGSQREDRYDELISRIREEQLPESAYRWYLDLRKFGSVPHSGFGLGLERTITWITGNKHVREAIPFPRTISRLYP
ncbi:MAG: asparagine--tRNA ligase [Spirochaetes bacterium]|nr:asparagine--tRNA ligase [Spirochaetota bacterium]